MSIPEHIARAIKARGVLSDADLYAAFLDTRKNIVKVADNYGSYSNDTAELAAYHNLVCEALERFGIETLFERDKEGYYIVSKVKRCLESFGYYTNHGVKLASVISNAIGKAVFGDDYKMQTNPYQIPNLAREAGTFSYGGENGFFLGVTTTKPKEEAYSALMTQGFRKFLELVVGTATSEQHSNLADTVLSMQIEANDSKDNFYELSVWIRAMRGEVSMEVTNEHTHDYKSVTFPVVGIEEVSKTARAIKNALVEEFKND